MQTIQPNAYVVLDYVLADDNGEIVDRSDAEDGEPIRYVHGYGMLVPGLETRLVGLALGDVKDILVPAAEGFGEYNDELVLEVERGEFPDPKGISVGDEFIAESPDGEEAVMHVVELRDDFVVVDANHPLAGVDLKYSVTVRELRAATSDEIEVAARELEAAEDEAHVHGSKFAPDVLPSKTGLGGVGVTNDAKRQSRKIETVGDLLFWSYANLAAAVSAEARGLAHQDQLSWMIRAKLFKGLRDGTMGVGSLFGEVREMRSDRCVYCGATPPPKLHGDHLIARHRGGTESGDNLVWACRSCNSSKGARDLLEWYAIREAFPPIVLMRRYLKLAMAEARRLGIMDTRLVDKPSVTFSLEHVPTIYPTAGMPAVIKRWVPPPDTQLWIPKLSR